MENLAAELREMTGGTGFDDVFCYAPVAVVVELCSAVLGRDGCLNFFAGPTDKQFSAKMNFYDVHYNSNACYGHDRRQHRGYDRIARADRLWPHRPGGYGDAYRRSGCGSRDYAQSAEDSGRQKADLQSHLTMPLTALTDLRAKGAEDARFTALADIVDAHNGLWCPEAEEYLLANFQQHD